MILYATRELIAPEIAGADDAGRDPFVLRSIVDIPLPGTRIGPGEPVMTLLARGDDVEGCHLRLKSSEREWMERLGLVLN